MSSHYNSEIRYLLLVVRFHQNPVKFFTLKIVRSLKKVRALQVDRRHEDDALADIKLICEVKPLGFKTKYTTKYITRTIKDKIKKVSAYTLQFSRRRSRLTDNVKFIFSGVISVLLRHKSCLSNALARYYLLYHSTCRTIVWFVEHHYVQRRMNEVIDYSISPSYQQLRGIF
ncbi:MAG: hypothetical protein HRT37_25030 [Alteromonadaceae bacterium]|nr:hypothetical protein [Alteromonadaceae bacterium]